MGKRPSVTRQKPVQQVKKPTLLEKLAKAAPAGRVATDPKAAILEALTELQGWARKAPFVTLRTKAEKAAAAKAGLVSRAQYLALISEARALVEGTDDPTKLSEHREPIGQRLYYGARQMSDGDFAGHVGFTRKRPDGFVAGPRAAGVFSSRVTPRKK